MICLKSDLLSGFFGPGSQKITSSANDMAYGYFNLPVRHNMRVF